MSRGKWGCPDWRDVDAYPESYDSIEEWAWKWEFTRRSAKYRDLWRSGKETEDCGYRIVRDLRKHFDAADLFGIDVFPDPRWPAEKLKGNPFTVIWPQAIQGSSPLKLAKFLGLDFEKEDSVPVELVIGLLQALAVVHYWPRVAEGGGIEHPPVQTIAFNLGRPIPPQIEAAEALLRRKVREAKPISWTEGMNPKIQSRVWRKEEKFWPRYLRVIDADDAGIGPKELFLEIMATELDAKSYDEQVSGASNPSQLGKNLISSARGIMQKIISF